MLFSLQGQQNVTQVLDQVRSGLMAIGTTNNDIGVQLAAIYALGQQSLKHPDAVRAVAFLQEAFPMSEAVRGLAPTNFMLACTVCAGNGEMSTGCLSCGQSGRCKECAAQPKGTPCPACQGTGTCPKCGGKGVFVNTCSSCKGARRILSTQQMQVAFRSSLKSCSQNLGALRQQRALPPVAQSTAANEWAPFLALYAPPATSAPAAPSPAAATVTPAAQTVCLFDAVVEFCRRSNTDLSVDPEAVANLQRCSLAVSTFLVMTNLDAVTRQIEANGMVLRQAPMNAKRNVRFITTQSIWAYSLGCWYIQSNQPDKALQMLESSPLDQTGLSGHARNLAGVLKTIGEDRRTLDETARTVRASLAEYAAARKDAGGYMGGAKNLRKPVKPDEREAAAILRLQKAEENLRRASPLVGRFMGRIEHSLTTLGQQFVVAETCTLRSESVFLLDYALQTFNTLKGLATEVEKAGLDAGELRNEAIPDDIRDLRGQIADTVRVAASLIAPTGAGETGDTAKSLVQYRRAFALDQANLYARVGTGYCTIQNHIRNIGSILYENRPADDELRTLGQEFARLRKSSYAAACARIAGESVQPEQTAQSNGSRTATGLAVVLEEGEALRLSVHFRPAVRPVAAPAARRGYWSAYNQALLGEIASVPVTFGDYGKKDLFMQLSAIQVYKWLSYAFPTEMAGQGMHVEFHDLLMSKAGDSAGVTMGIAGYAALRQTEVRRDVAFTGSIRADGSVHGVGAVPAKIAGTLQVEGIELVIVPKENEPDLLLVPLDQLCRIAIVTSDNMQTYVKHATGAGDRRDVLDDVRRAQVLLLTGRRNECRTILAPIAQKYPDIYTARRLVDIISFHEQSAGLAPAPTTGKAM
jgi:hypothetical protein